MFETTLKIKQKGMLTLTRNDKAVNPLFCYNGVGINTFNNNTWIKANNNLSLKIIGFDALVIVDENYLEYNYEINLDNSILIGEQL